MFTLLTAYVDNARRRLAEHNARAAIDDYPTAGDDEAYGDEFEYYGDEQTAAGDVGLEHDNKDGVADDAGSGQELASIEDLRELERHLGMGSGGSDGSMTEIDDTPAPDAERLGAEERARRAGENVDWAAMGDNDRAASFSVWDQIVRIAAEDRRIADEKERRRRELECGPNCVHCTADSDSDSDSDAGSTREGSEPPTAPTSSNEPDDGHAARAEHSPPPDAVEISDEARERSPTPDVDTAPLANYATPPRKQKRARSDDDDDAADALWEKRRRVDTEEQPGSPRPRAGRRNDRNQNGAGSSTAVTRSTLHESTAASTAPQHALEGATVAVHIQHANWSDEAPMASTSALPAAGPSQAVAMRARGAKGKAKAKDLA